MRVLKRGLIGADVKRWQQFLTGQGLYRGVVDGDFGQHTHDATVAFQRRERLLANGIVDNTTLGRAMQLGFPVVEDPTESREGPNWPPRPDFEAISASGRRALFGAFRFQAAPTASNPERIQILGDWVPRNIIQVRIPQLVGVADAPADGVIPFHRLAAPQLVAMWAAWEAAGLLPLVLSYAGSFAPRFIRGSRTTLSNHAFGSAFDINVAQNRLGVRPALVGQRGSVRELVPIANEHGFFWGGHFRTRPDGMHFEIARLV